jgi:hypothetical protein
MGRNSKFGEKTKTLTFRCPLSKAKLLTKIVNTQLAKWQKTGKRGK